MRNPSRISVRGTLAHELAQRLVASPNPRQAAQEFLRELTCRGDAEVQQFADGGTLIIGRKNERGHFPPDW